MQNSLPFSFVICSRDNRSNAIIMRLACITSRFAIYNPYRDNDKITITFYYNCIISSNHGEAKNIMDLSKV